jgi:hypothetical protein
MREAYLILRKDVRHLWPRIVLVAGFAALEGLFGAGSLVGNPIQTTTLTWLWAFSCAYLAASAVQEERLPGHEQYWLTRPIGRWHLLLAKVLLLAVFAVLPRVAGQAALLAVNGVSPLRHAWLLGFIALFSMGIALAAAALAAVTGSLLQFLWVLLPIAALEIPGLMGSGRDVDWDNVAWIRSSALGALVLLAAAAILMVQYQRPKTVLAGCILAMTVGITAMGPFLGTWHAAFALQGKLAGQAGPSAVRISFDPGQPAAGKYTADYGPPLAGIDLPLGITGIPPGAHLISERITTTIEAPGGDTWRSGWTTTGAIANPNPLDDSHVIRADGAYRGHLYVDAQFYRASKGVQVHLHASVALTLLGEVQSAPISASGRTHLPGDGICRVAPVMMSRVQYRARGRAEFFNNLLAYCLWPAQAPARADVQTRSSKTGQEWGTPLFPPGSYAPFPIDGSVWSSAAAIISVRPEPVEMRLETWKAIAHFERDLDIPQIRLADYAVPSITDPK